MDKEDPKSDNTVTLRLKDYDFTVGKDKLSQVSRYFAALFSHKFKDSTETVHIINFEIHPRILKIFVDWMQIEESRESVCSVRSCLAAILSEDLTQLLELLKLSALYAIDQLADDIIGVIATKWLQPDRVIDIWKLAQELSLSVLQDLCIASCLDRFMELPQESLIQLSKKNILQLIEAKCIKASQSYMSHISVKWSQYHGEQLTIRPNYNTEPTYTRCTVGYKTGTLINKKPYIYCWDGTSYIELLELKDCERGNDKKEIVGMQATGRGFSVYVIGGERGFGTGNFNMEIWRYCLISQRWYYQTRMPVARRHMVTVFLDNKLVIVGGVGRLRLKLSSVDIFDIHTGVWNKAAKVPEEFTEVPVHCVTQDKLFLLKSSIYIYHLKQDFWQTIELPKNSPANIVDAFVKYGKTVFFTYSNDSSNERTMLFRIETGRVSTCSVNKCLITVSNHVVTDDMSTVLVKNESYQLRFACLTGIKILFLVTNSKPWSHINLHIHREEINDSHPNYINPKMGCFDLINRNILRCQLRQDD